MKDTEKNTNMLNFLAFISLMVFAILEIFGFLSPIIELGATISNLLNTIKNICIIIVIGLLAYKFVENKSKGYKIAYWIAIAIFVVSTILVWVFNK